MPAQIYLKTADIKVLNPQPQLLIRKSNRLIFIVKPIALSIQIDHPRPGKDLPALAASGFNARDGLQNFYGHITVLGGRNRSLIAQGLSILAKCGTWTAEKHNRQSDGPRDVAVWSGFV